MGQGQSTEHIEPITSGCETNGYTFHNVHCKNEVDEHFDVFKSYGLNKQQMLQVHVDCIKKKIFVKMNKHFLIKSNHS